MSSSKEVKYTSRSITPPAQRQRSRSSSRSRGRSRSRSQDSLEADNPGNNLYVTGLSTRVTNEDLEKYFSKEGKVQECQVVMDPRTKESRGFAFVTMETVEDANRCIKYLNRSVLEGRLMVVEKAKRRRGRTPTPGKYRGARERSGARERRVRRRKLSRSCSPSKPPRCRGHSHSRERCQRERSRSPRGIEARRRLRERSMSAGSDRQPD
ncbi:serine/arginine-rich splicing factor SR45a isoform X7 [Dendrobium catenatum]|uniref:31 kDa ribonucleoprotein, chloroplastic n=1 Tax=Dendrobium catenatum TaxID=906689 RepID=A0A2I0X4P7_9ASPA|nr:serine/arginine-rich splicing factor SR45a isoform X7 [Dendrobium catenatum]PKU82885.1 31 kDa ribonucleoprotein, chloroplastic [Dendrobium catenatum]